MVLKLVQKKNNGGHSEDGCGVATIKEKLKIIKQDLHI